jgi:hypothetical protein
VLHCVCTSETCKVLTRICARHRSNRSQPEYSITIDIGSQQIAHEAVERSPATGFTLDTLDSIAPPQPWHIRVKSGDVQADYTEINGAFPMCSSYTIPCACKYC